MSHEFYQIMVGAPTMSLYSWKQLARWSIDYSCLSPDDQKSGHEILAQDWRRFCKSVVEKCDGLMVNDRIERITPEDFETIRANLALLASKSSVV
jgi:adenosine deaminase CECR1